MTFYVETECYVAYLLMKTKLLEVEETLNFCTFLSSFLLLYTWLVYKHSLLLTSFIYCLMERFPDMIKIFVDIEQSYHSRLFKKCHTIIFVMYARYKILRMFVIVAYYSCL